MSDTGNAAFEKAAQDARTLPKSTSNADLLEIYALYKQGTVGDNTTDRPGLFDPTGRAKWDAWTAKKGLSKEDAQAQYIAFVNQKLGA
ncbi:acyl-CoA-binding protein [Thamnocephalis sphaerospora]|uniref:Acyl-CoA-binding protein n=1 Tax=Thamnocephalis sphaerospora TaxID=78915 RepID=A0A4P9XUY0_9FUNG|nr:acyl-CoA-binding protein [Thamnocephalis sphaerospora]|eukprot:RKP09391.1 acyl-CoA-binding protein [Thamnocephalis sphaerospora]